MVCTREALQKTKDAPRILFIGWLCSLLHNTSLPVACQQYKLKLKSGRYSLLWVFPRTSRRYRCRVLRHALCSSSVSL